MQFCRTSLFRLMSLLTTLCLGLGFARHKVTSYTQTVERIRQLGGYIDNGYDFSPCGFYSRPTPPKYMWLQRYIGGDYFVRVIGIDLAGTNVQDQDLLVLSSFPEIKYLELGSTKITKVGIKHLSSLPSLRSLGLAGTSITDEVIEDLAQLEQLERLDVWGTAFSSEGLVKLQIALPRTHIDDGT